MPSDARLAGVDPCEVRLRGGVIVLKVDPHQIIAACRAEGEWRSTGEGKGFQIPTIPEGGACTSLINLSIPQ